VLGGRAPLKAPAPPARAIPPELLDRYDMLRDTLGVNVATEELDAINKG
jgi:hypothetical protein